MVQSITSPSIVSQRMAHNGLSLHHVGFVVESIAESVEHFLSALHMSWGGQVFHDPIQTVRATFLQHGLIGSPFIELIEPATPESRVSAFLRRGGGLHHLCYEVDELRLELENAVSAGSILLLSPSPAVAFNGREIAWICTPDRLLVEYLQRDSSRPSPLPGS